MHAARPRRRERIAVFVKQWLSPSEWVLRFEATREAQRQREINAGCRLDEVRLVLHRGTAEERRNYLVATRARREAGEPDVPFIAQWYAQAPEPDVEIGG
jgi:hypothetical protein